MGGKNEVTLTFAGDSTSLDRTFDNLGSGARKMGTDVDDQTSKLDRLGEAGGTAETRFLGLGAGISGVSTIMSGDAGPEDYAMAMADLGDSIEHTVIPVLKSVGTQIMTTGRAAVTSAAQHVASAARVVAGWVLMGIQATVNAAKMAVAWLVSLGPIGLVIAAVGAVIAILVALGVGFDDLGRWAGAAWAFILGAGQAVFNWLAENWPLVLAILTGPIGLAVLAIVNHWDTIKNAFTAVKDWIGDRVGDIVGFFVGLPGRMAAAAGDMFGWIGRQLKAGINGLISIWNGFRFPSWSVPKVSIPGLGSIGGGTIGGWALPQITPLAKGGIVTRPTLAMIGEAGPEAVVPLRSGGMAGPTINIYVQGSLLTERDLIGRVRDELLRGGFGGAR